MSLRDLAMELFCQFDDENKGYITQDQLLNGSCKDGLFSEFSEGQILSIFELLDKENKGVITLSDFTDAFVTDTNETTTNEDQYFHQSERSSIQAYSPMFDGEEIYARSPSPSAVQVYSYGSMESLPGYGEESIQKELRRSMSCQSEEDWWGGFSTHHVEESLDLSMSVNRKRTDSLPSIMDPLILKRTKKNLLNSKRWVSVDQGIDQSFIATNGLNHRFEENNNLKNKRLNGFTKSDSRIDKILVPLKKLSKHLSNSKNELRINKEKRVRKKRKGPSLFGSRDSVLSSIRCSSCASVRSNDKYYSSNEDISFNRGHPTHYGRRQRSHSNLLQVQKPIYMKQSSYEHLCSDIDCSDNESALSKHNSYLSHDSLLSNQNGGFYISCENVSSPIVDVSAESWETFLRRIGGVSLFAGNTKLRYLWKQISSYQHDLLFNFEDFLKGVVEEHKTVLTKCQDVESTLHSKIEQHEKAIDCVYEELEKTLSKELSHQEKQFTDREDSLRSEYKHSLDMKEATCQENLRFFTEITEKYDHCKQELFLLQEKKSKNDTLHRQTVEEHLQMSSDYESISHENKLLKDQLKQVLDQNREFQECISQMSTNVKTEQEKYQSFVRKYEDLLEEKEFLEANITNLSWENVELRNMNNSMKQKPEDMSLNASINSNMPDLLSPIKDRSPSNDIIMTSSPRGQKGRKKKLLPLISLQEEMEEGEIESELNGEYYTDDAGVASESDENIDIELNKTLQEELQESEDLDITVGQEVFEDDDLSFMLNNEKEEEQRKTSTTSITSIPTNGAVYNDKCAPMIRFATNIQTNFKVIFCGDANVGKSSIIQRICFDSFSEEREPTMQIDSYSKTVPHGENIVNLSIWDTLGQERFNSIPRSYYRKSDIVLVGYDITDEMSFSNLQTWLLDIKEFTDDNVLVIIVGNKVDSEGDRKISCAKAEQYAKAHNAMFMEVSAKSGQNIQSLLHIMSSTLVNQAEYVMVQNNFDVSSNAQTANLMVPQKKLLNKHPCCQ
eukprot:TCONS_00023681-protein